MQKVDRGDDLWAMAQELHVADRFKEAEDIYTKLLEQNHDNAGVMAALGSLYGQTERFGLAIHFLEAGIKAAKNDLPDAWTNLGHAYQKSGQRAKAIQAYERSISKNPTKTAMVNYAAMFVECGQDDKCMELCERAIAIGDSDVAHWNLGIALLANGKWERGWKEHEHGLKLENMRPDRDLTGAPLWDGKAPGAIHVTGEQGIGDEIMFASMLPDLMKTNKVVLECYPRLETLFRKSFPDAAVYGTRDKEEVTWAGDHKIEHRIAIGSLGQFYRPTVGSCPGTPYLKADPLLPKGEKLRIGISWIGGGAKMGRVAKRSVPLPWWKPILDFKDVEFVSLQYTDANEDLELVRGMGYAIKEYDEVKAQDYYETARLVASCDLVITVCTSLVHLAGALGVKCWVMTPKYPAWRYQNSGHMPWYRSVRLYRAPFEGSEGWMPVIHKIAMDLESLSSRPRLQAVA